MPSLSDLADAELAQLIATTALLPFGQRVAFVQRVAAALAAGEARSSPLASYGPCRGAFGRREVADRRSPGVPGPGLPRRTPTHR